MRAPSALVISLALLLSVGAEADQNGGSISMPLKAYHDLQQKARSEARPAPAGYALGKAEVQVSASAEQDNVTAEVEVSLAIRVYDDRWVIAPVLAAGTSMSTVTVDGEPVQLVTTPAGLAWSTKESGTHTMKLTYQVDASRTDAGFRLSIPVPQAAATTLTATLPGRNVEAAVIPAAGMQTTSDGKDTTVKATIPTTGGVHISWRRESTHRYAISRAAYRGQLVGDALTVTGKLSVDLFSAESVLLPLLPDTVTLKEVLVDGKRRGILLEEKESESEEGEEGQRSRHFVTLVKGRGTHEVSLSLSVPVKRGEGPPEAVINIPQVPVSRFELTLPGKKEVAVEPGTSVSHLRRGTGTVAQFNVPLSSKVTVRWSESAPVAAQEETRANAEVYHLIHAEEGVLHARAVVVYQVSRGQTNSITLELPAVAQVNRVTSESGAIADWRSTRVQKTKAQQVAVFLDRQVRGELVFEVAYEVLLGQGRPSATQKDQPVLVPLMRVLGTHRQRGMAALLATKELALKPVAEQLLTRVGENQLPASVRQRLDKTVAHTYKYSESDPRLTVRTTTPTRKPGRFDAQVDTLVSLADVALQGSARVEINVKSGTITSLQLALPEAANLLSLSAPSLRSHKAEHRGKMQIIELQFTQEMEGQFKIDVLYERILSDSESELQVPTLAARGAEVEQGRIAVEALAAVEVKPVATDHLSSLDVNELPRQLVLKTTNPILLAYKYAHITPPYRLGLRMTRHREVDVQAATIDKGQYQTLCTRDGLVVTRARFAVRNTRKQFLKIELPPDSEVWSAFVNDQAVKPALEPGREGRAPSVLIKIINSAAGFPVELIYATRAESIGGLGTLSARLPRPDTVVTHTQWDVYVPEGLSYRSPQTNMELLENGRAVLGDEIITASESKRPAAGQVTALRISVPASGVHYRFAKLYANQSDEPPSFQLAYASRSGAVTSEVISVVATLALWLGLLLWQRRGVRGNVPALVSGGLGLVLLCITLGYLQRGVSGPVTVSALLLLGIGGRHGLSWHRRWRASRPRPEPVVEAALPPVVEPAVVPPPQPPPTPQQGPSSDGEGEPPEEPPATTPEDQ